MKLNQNRIDTSQAGSAEIFHIFKIFISFSPTHMFSSKDLDDPYILLSELNMSFDVIV